MERSKNKIKVTHTFTINNTQVFGIGKIIAAECISTYSLHLSYQLSINTQHHDKYSVRHPSHLTYR